MPAWSHHLRRSSAARARPIASLGALLLSLSTLLTLSAPAKAQDLIFADSHVDANLYVEAYFPATIAVDYTLPRPQQPYQTPLTYDLTPVDPLPSGIIFDANKGKLVGKPERLPSGDYGSVSERLLDYRVLDARGRKTQFVEIYLYITSPPPAPIFQRTQGDLRYTVSGETGTTLPVAGKGAGSTATDELSYDLSGPDGGDLPGGLSFLPATRQVSNRPNAPTSAEGVEVTYTATDSIGASVEQMFRIFITPAPTLDSSAPISLSFGIDVPDERTLPRASGGVAPLSFTLTPDSSLQPGLSFVSRDGKIIAMPTDTEDVVLGAAGVLTFFYNVIDANGVSGPTSGRVIVYISVFGPPEFSASQPNLSFARNRMIDPPVTLPEAVGIPRDLGGGKIGLLYALPGRPAGLSFNPDSRELSGRPTALNTEGTKLTFTATDVHDKSGSLTFEVFVLDPPSFTPNQETLTYTVGQTGISLSLPEATGSSAGGIAYTFAGTGALAGINLSLDEADRILSGKPTGTTSETVITMTATDAAGLQASYTLRLTVVTAPSFGAETVPDKSYTAGTEIDLDFPAVLTGTGHASLSFTLRPAAQLSQNLPGLSFDATATPPTLSGALASTASASSMDYTYSAIDANKVSTSLTFTITVGGALVFGAQPDQTFTAGHPVNLTLAVATGGIESRNYTLSPILEDNGLSFTADTRVLAGKPLSSNPSQQMTLSVTDSASPQASASRTFNITVVAAPSFNAAAEAAVAGLSFTQNWPISALELPTAQGGAGAPEHTFRSYDGLVGLSFTKSGGVYTLSGEPSSAPGDYDLVWSATDDNGASASLSFTVSVAAALSFDAAAEAAVAGLSFTQNTGISDLELPTAQGGAGTLEHTFSSYGGLAGLSFTTSGEVHTLSGVPTSPPGDYDLVWSATDENGASASLSFRVTVVAEPNFAQLDNLSYAVNSELGEEDTALLPEAEDGAHPLSYTLTGANATDSNPDLPAGLSFNVNTRQLSGMPAAPIAAGVPLTYTVTDANGAEDEGVFSLFIFNSPRFHPSEAELTYTAGQAEVLLTLPEADANDHTGDINYAYEVLVDGELGSDSLSQIGLALNENNGVLRGMPILPMSGEIEVSILVSATGGAPGEMAVYVLSLFVVAAPSFGGETVPDQSYAADTDINLDFPEVEDATGAATLSFSLAPLAQLADNLPGLSFDATATPPTLSGRLAATASMSSADYTYTVTDANEVSASLTFTIVVGGALVFGSQGDLTFTAGHPVNQTLAAATGGLEPRSYTLSPILEANGLSFTTGATRVLAGTPLAAAASQQMSLSVRDSADPAGSASLSFTITVAAALSFAPQEDLSYTQNTEISDLVLPTASGGVGTLEYTFGSYDGLAGLSFTTSGGVHTLGGAPTSQPGDYQLVWSATDTNGARATLSFTVTVAAEPNFSLANQQADLSYGMGFDIDPVVVLPEADDGVPELSYTLTRDGDSNLQPIGLSFTRGSRELSGNPSAAAGDYELTYTATDANRAAAVQTFTVSIFTPPSFDPNQAALSFTVGQAAVLLTLPTPDEGVGDFDYAYARTGAALAAGLSFTENNDSPGVLSGAPTVAGGETTYTMTATDELDLKAIYTLLVSAVAAPSFASGVSNQTYTAGGTASLAFPLLQTNTGVAPLSFTLNPVVPTALPQLSFNALADPPTLSGTLDRSSAASSAAYTYTAIDANGVSASLTFGITVNTGLGFVFSQEELSFTAGHDVDVVLPAAVANTGTSPLTYKLAPDPLPAALHLSFNPNSRRLSGTPTEIVAATELTYTVTDANEAEAERMFSVSVAGELTFPSDATIPDQTYTIGGDVSFAPPRATGGVGELTYTLDPGGPADLSVTDDSRLSGTIATTNTAGDYQRVWRVEDLSDNLASAELSFTITLVDPASFAAFQTDLSYPVDDEIATTFLPDADGGHGTLSFSLTGPGATESDPALPAGLDFNVETRQLSGTPTALDTAGTLLSYTVTDANDVPTEQSFTVFVIAPPVFTPAAAAMTFTVTQEIDLTLPTPVGNTVGAAVFSFSYTGGSALTATGLNFAENANMPGVVSGAATSTSSGEVEVVMTATDQHGLSADYTLSLSVVDKPSFVGGDTVDDQSFTAGQQNIVVILPQPGEASTLALNPDIGGNLPGLSFDGTASPPEIRGALSTALGAVAATAYTYTSTDANDVGTGITFTITVNEALSFTGSSPAGQTFAYTAEHPVTALTLPKVGGGTPPYRNYALELVSAMNDLPGGLSFDPATRLMSGTPTTFFAEQPLTYRVSDSADSGGDLGHHISLVFQLSVAAALDLPGGDLDDAELSYTKGRALSLTLPAATGGQRKNVAAGVPDLDYSFSATPPLTGLTLEHNPSGAPLYRLAGTEAQTNALRAGDYAASWRVADVNGATGEVTFTITIADPPTFDALPNLSYGQNDQINTTLPRVNAGSAPYDYGLSTVGGGELPEGLSFNEDTRVLSGSLVDTLTGGVALSYDLRDSSGATAEGFFSLFVFAAPSFEDPAEMDLSYTAGQGDINNLTLPAPTGGAPDFSFAFTRTGTLAAGLSFTESTRVLRGAPSAPGAEAVITMTVTDQLSRQASYTLRVRVLSPPSFGGLTVEEKAYTADGDVALTFPAVVAGTGHRPLSFTLNPDVATNLPALVFDDTADPPTVTGRLDDAAGVDRAAYTYTVTDANGVSARLTFGITVSGPLNFAAATIPDQTYDLNTGTAALTLPTAMGGQAPLVYRLSGVPNGQELPAGLSYNANGNTAADPPTVTGTPSRGVNAVFTYTVTDTANASLSLNFRITVTGAPAFGDDAMIPPQTFTAGAMFSLTLPAASDATSYGTSAPSAVTWLSTLGRVLSGTPPADAAGQSYAVLWRALNDASAEAGLPFTISVVAAPTFGGATVEDQSYTRDRAITALTLPALSSGGAGELIYAISGLAGLSFEEATDGGRTVRTLQGAPTASAGNYTMVWSATDVNGAADALSFAVTVFELPQLPAAAVALSYTAGFPLADLYDTIPRTLPAATGGRPPLSYTLSEDDSDALQNIPPGLALHPTSRLLSGTPEEPTGGSELSYGPDYTVRDANSATDAITNVSIVIVPGLGFNAASNVVAGTNYRYTKGETIDPLTLPGATGGQGTLSFALSPDLTSEARFTGLAFDTGTQVLSGDVDGTGGQLVWTATDASGASITRTFGVVSSGPFFEPSTVPDQTYVQSRAIPPLTLPRATPGDPAITGATPITHVLQTELPAGLNFNTSNFVLSGTPRSSGAAILSFTATDSQVPPVSSKLLVDIFIIPELTFHAHNVGSNNNFDIETPFSLTLPEASGGLGAVAYVLSPPAADRPVWLTYTAATRVVSGNIPTRNESATLTFTVTDSAPSAHQQTKDLDFRVGSSGPFFEPSTVPDQTYVQSSAIPPLTLPRATPGDPNIPGATPINHVLQTELPAGLNFSNFVLSGTPRGSGTAILSFTATDMQDPPVSSSLLVDITIIPELTFHYNVPSNNNFDIETPFTITLPEASGGQGALAYVLSPIPPTTNLNWLTYTAATRVVSGNIPTRNDSATLTFTVTDSAPIPHQQTKNLFFRVGSSGPYFEVSSLENRSYDHGRIIAPLTLPLAQQGAPELGGRLSYALSDAAGALPAGLRFQPGRRVLTGRPTEKDDKDDGGTELTYRAIDAEGEAQLIFTVAVVDPLRFADPSAFEGFKGCAVTRPGVYCAYQNVPFSGTLPAASDGFGTPIYTLVDAAGSGTQPLTGLGFDATNRTLSGTPTELKSAAFVYSATDEGGRSNALTFRLTIVTPPSFAAEDTGLTFTYASGAEISPPLRLPAANDGIGALSYTLVVDDGSALPAGLSFASASRQLSGTPTSASSTTLSFTATDENGASSDALFQLEVVDGPVFAVASLADRSYAQNAAIPDLELPAASASSAITYALATLPTGLTFDAAARVLSGTPTAAATTALTFTASVAGGGSAARSFNIRVLAGPVFAADSLPLPDRTYSENAAIPALQLPAVVASNGAVRYTLATLPTGLSFDEATRELSGAPDTAAATQVVYTATDSSGGTSLSFGITVITAPVFLAPVAVEQTFSRGAAVVMTLPAVLFATDPTYRLTGETLRAGASRSLLRQTGGDDLPAGLNFNPSTRVLRGIPQVLATHIMTYTATAGSEVSSMTFSVKVDAALRFLATMDASQVYAKDAPIPTLQLPAAVGGSGVKVYTLTPPVAGLSFSPLSRQLSGTPTAVGITEVNYAVVDASNAVEVLRFDIRVDEEELFEDETEDLNYPIGVAIPDMTLPASSSTNTPVSYALAPLPEGLAFAAATRVLSGTPTRAGSSRMNYTATDSTGFVATQEFTLAVAAKPSFTTRVADQTYEKGANIPPLELPPVSGGFGDITYTLGPTLPRGLNFDDTVTPPTLSGAPTTAGETLALTYRASDSRGDSANPPLVFQVTIGTALSRLDDLNRVLLPEVARAIADQTVGAIARRIDQAKGGHAAPEEGVASALGGKSSWAALLSSHGMTLLGGEELDLKDLLGSSHFVLPLNAAKADAEAAAGSSSVSLWGAGDYRHFSNKEDALDWSGDLVSAHLGMDMLMSDNLLAGLAVSQSRSEIDYKDTTDRGTHEVEMSSFYPYLGWTMFDGNLELWATAGYGRGDLEIRDDAQLRPATSDVEMITLGAGMRGLLLASNHTTLHFKGDALQAQMEAEESDTVAALEVDVSRVRLAIEASQLYTQSDGASVEPLLELGLRYDDGDGDSVSAMELGLGVRHSAPSSGITLEGRMHTLVGRDDYEEWGLHGLLQYAQATDGRGLSLNLSSRYGADATPDVQEIWQRELELSGATPTSAYAMHLNARLGYGLQPATSRYRALLTPFTEFRLDETTTHTTLGLHWQLPPTTDLQLQWTNTPETPTLSLKATTNF